MRHVLYAVLFLVAGCATIESSLERRVQLFEVTSFQFENAIRWGYYERAYAFLKNDGSEQKKPDFEKLASVKVSSYEVVKSMMSPGDLTVDQTVEISYYSIRMLVEKKLIHSLKWEFDTEQNSWHITSSFPDFTP